MTYEKRMEEILADQSSSDWLKRAVLALDKRDPVDAVHDAELLAMLQERRPENAYKGAK